MEVNIGWSILKPGDQNYTYCGVQYATHTPNNGGGMCESSADIMGDL